MPATTLEVTQHDLADIVDALIDAGAAARAQAETAGSDRELAEQASAKAARLERLIGIAARTLTSAVKGAR